MCQRLTLFSGKRPHSAVSHSSPAAQNVHLLSSFVALVPLNDMKINICCNLREQRKDYRGRPHASGSTHWERAWLQPPLVVKGTVLGESFKILSCLHLPAAPPPITPLTVVSDVLITTAKNEQQEKREMLSVRLLQM